MTQPSLPDQHRYLENVLEHRRTYLQRLISLRHSLHRVLHEDLIDYGKSQMQQNRPLYDLITERTGRLSLLIGMELYEVINSMAENDTQLVAALMKYAGDEIKMAESTAASPEHSALHNSQGDP